MYAHKIITPPSDLPVTLARAKEHLRVLHDDEDNMILLYIAAATAHAEQYLQRKLMPQTAQEKRPFPHSNCPLELSANPVRSITSFSYWNNDVIEAEVEIEETDYQIDKQSSIATLYPKPNQYWPQTSDRILPVTIVYEVGYEDQTAIPQDIIHAILLLLTTMYERREDTVKQLPTMAENLLNRHKIHTAQWH